MPNLVVLPQTILENFHPKPSDAALSKIFRDNFRQEVDCDVISGLTVYRAGAEVIVKVFFYSRSKRSQDIRAAHFVVDDDERTKNDGGGRP